MSSEQQPAPTQLGRYRIVRRIGIGGMAEVFLARTAGAEGIEKLLVVKRILPTYATSPKFVTMFLEEARIAARLNHPNIIQVYAFEQVEREFLLAMEYVDGLDLARLLRALRRGGQRIPPKLAAYIVMEVAKGLDYAHRRRDERGLPLDIVHRDISPQNVLISHEGSVKLADFGIARARAMSEETGTIKGKFSYMSPEQAQGRRVDRRADIYGLGALLYELVSGEQLYGDLKGADMLDVVRRGKYRPLEAVGAKVPASLALVVEKSLRFMPEERFASARAMAATLRDFLHAQEHMVDAEDLERFVARSVPRKSPSVPSAATRGEVTSPTVSERRPAQTEVRDRRNVIVVAGAVRPQPNVLSGATAVLEEGLDEIGARVLSDIAYKNDAVLSWTDQTRKRFRLVLGLHRSSGQDALQAMRLAADVLESLSGRMEESETPVIASLGVARSIVSTVRNEHGRLLSYASEGYGIDAAGDLAEAGAPGEVLVTAEVYRMVRRVYAFDVDKVRMIDVAASKGERSLRSYPLRGALGRVERARRAIDVPDVVLGRDGSVQWLCAQFDATERSGKSRAIALVGELGIGKTTTTAAALAKLEDRAVVLHATCAFGHGRVPYGLVADVLRDAGGINDNAPPRERLATFRRFAQGAVQDDTRRKRMLHALEPLIENAEAHANVAARSSAGHDRMIASALKTLFVGLTAHRPFILWIDSLQWIDSASLDVLQTLLERSYDIPLLTVLCSREPLRSRLSSIEQSVLSPLTPSESAKLVSQCLAGANVPEELSASVIERAGGNPFFIVELVETLLDKRILTLRETEGGGLEAVRAQGVPITIPNSLEGIVASRLDELDVRELRVLRWVAVAGVGVDDGLLHQLGERDAHPVLERLEQKGFLQLVGAHQYRIPSGVTRQVVYENLDPEERANMHQRVGAHLAGQADHPPSALIARHFEQGEAPSKAADWYIKAAKSAQRTHATAEAYQFYSRALDLLSANSSRRFLTHTEREDLLRSMGRTEDRRRELDAILRLAEDRSFPERKATALARLGRYQHDLNQFGSLRETAEQTLRAAKANGERRYEIEALRLLSVYHRSQAAWDDALSLCEQALVLCTGLEDGMDERALTLVQQGLLLRRMGRHHDAAAAYTEAIVIFDRLENSRQQSVALNSLGVALASMGHLEDAATVIRTSLSIDRDLGETLHAGRKLSNIGQLYAILGDLALATQFLERAVVTAERTADPEAVPDALCALAELMLDRGAPPKSVLVHLDRAKKALDKVDNPYHQARERMVRADALRRIEPAQAVRVAQAAARLGESSSTGYRLMSLAVLARCQVETGTMEAARENVERVLDELEQDQARDAVEREDRLLAVLVIAARSMDEELFTRAMRVFARTLQRQLSVLRSPVFRRTYLEGLQKLGAPLPDGVV